MFYRESDREILPKHIKNGIENAKTQVQCPGCGCNPLLPKNSNFCNTMARSAGNLAGYSIKEGIKLSLAVGSGAGIVVKFIETASGESVEVTDKNLDELAEECNIVYSDEGTYCPECAEDEGLLD